MGLSKDFKEGVLFMYAGNLFQMSHCCMIKYLNAFLSTTVLTLEDQ